MLGDELRKLTEVFEAGFITEDEFLLRKDELNSSVRSTPTQAPRPSSLPQQTSTVSKKQKKNRRKNKTPQQDSAISLPDTTNWNEVDPVISTFEFSTKTKDQILATITPQHTGKLVTSTTLVVMPPKHLWGPFVEIKKNHMNPRIKRPPYPHITILQPFVNSSQFDEAEKALREVLANVQPFRLNFSRFELFRNAGSATLYLDPEIEPPTALQDLYDIAAAMYPQVQQQKQKQSAFEPHIGVGYFKKQNEAVRLQKKYQTGWKSLDFVVQEIYIMSRIATDTPFEVRRVIPLGSQSAPPLFATVPE